MRFKSSDSIKKAVEILKEGGVVVFPTDTVWGIGASAVSKAGIERLYKIKKRKRGKPTAVLVSDLGMAEEMGEFSEEALLLVKKYWPGSLTIIVKAKERFVDSEIVSRKGTIGLRVPDNEVVLALIGKLGVGLIAGSANVSGGVAPIVFGDIDKGLLGKVDFVLDPVDGEAGSGEASTVVDATKYPFLVLREGLVEID